MDADAIVVGAGLAGLAAAAELADVGRRVLLLDQEPEQSLGGQAFWSLGGLFLVDSPEQRRMGVQDSLDLALQDWFGSAQFDRPEDHWPRQWAEAYVHFAAGEKRSWLRQMGHRFFPVVGWAERGDGRKLVRVASPHRLLDPAAGPLIAVRLNILTRKTLGGLQTDLDGRVLTADGTAIPGLYAAGEVAGFGGGGMHGYLALEGTFLGGCLFSGRTAGRAAAAQVG